MIALPGSFRMRFLGPRIFFCLAVGTMVAGSLPAGAIHIQVRGAPGVMEDAVLYAIPEGRVPPPPSQQAAVMDQKDRMFIPHVLPIQTGTAVEFPNSDDIRHHVYSFSAAKPFQLPLYKGTPSNPVIFDRAGVVTLGCNIHDKMSAFIVVVDTPYFAKTDAQGRAEIESLPPGKYLLRMWYPDMREEPRAVGLMISGEERHEVLLTVRR